MTSEQPPLIAVIGDRIVDSSAQSSIPGALEHAAGALGTPAPTVRWVPTDDLARTGTAALLGDAAGVWCAPGGPYRNLLGALAGIRFARETGIPFLGACAGFSTRSSRSPGTSPGSLMPVTASTTATRMTW
jgi:CTP synthase (UTP-ammonia lyase)